MCLIPSTIKVLKRKKVICFKVFKVLEKADAQVKERLSNAFEFTNIVTIQHKKGFKQATYMFPVSIPSFIASSGDTLLAKRARLENGELINTQVYGFHAFKRLKDAQRLVASYLYGWNRRYYIYKVQLRGTLHSGLDKLTESETFVGHEMTILQRARCAENNWKVSHG